MSLFDINIQEMFNRRLSSFLRSAPRLQYLYSIAKGLQTTNDNFVINRDEAIFKARFTSQTAYLEEYLNRIYDPILKRIYIDNVAQPQDNYMYNFLEERSPRIIIRNRSEAITPNNYLRLKNEAITAYDYIIYIPLAITFSVNEVRKRVDVYNASGMRYNIDTF